MHEMSLAENVLQIIEEAARADGFRRVTKVILEIGQLGVVDPEAMRFCFGAVMRDSLAEDALLEIVEVPGSGWCERCASTIPMSSVIATCPLCGGDRVQATGGKEMKLRALEVE